MGSSQPLEGIPVALVTGSTGQIASYLVELLLQKGYLVHGLSRSTTSMANCQYRDVYQSERVILHYGALDDAKFILNLVGEIRPNEIYNLGAQSAVHASWSLMEDTYRTNVLGPLNLLAAIRQTGQERGCRIIQAGTSEMFGQSAAMPQHELSPFSPSTPYATSKVAAYWMMRNARSKYAIAASNAIIFNHESRRRDKIARTQLFAEGIAKVHLGIIDSMEVGDPFTIRDWGHAKDLVRGLWMTLQHDTGDDFVFAAGDPHSIRDFLNAGFECVGTRLKWIGSGLDEVALDTRTGKVLVRIDRALYNTVSHNQWGDRSKAGKILGWHPEVKFSEMVREMVTSALDRIRANQQLKKATRDSGSRSGSAVDSMRRSAKLA